MAGTYVFLADGFCFLGWELHMQRHTEQREDLGRFLFWFKCPFPLYSWVPPTRVQDAEEVSVCWLCGGVTT